MSRLRTRSELLRASRRKLLRKGILVVHTMMFTNSTYTPEFNATKLVLQSHAVRLKTLTTIYPPRNRKELIHS